MNYIAHIDESGSLPDKSQSVIAVAALTVAEADVDSLRPILLRIQKRINRKRKRGKTFTGEFKFEKLIGQRQFKTIRQVLNAIARLSCSIFIVRVQKDAREIEDTPLNYAVLVSKIIRSCHHHYPETTFVIDRHFLVSQFDKMQTVNHTRAFDGRTARHPAQRQPRPRVPRFGFSRFRRWCISILDDSKRGTIWLSRNQRGNEFTCQADCGGKKHHVERFESAERSSLRKKK